MTDDDSKRLDEEFERAMVPESRGSLFRRENARLIPYIEAYQRRKRQDPKGVTSASRFYREFLKPNGITISESRFRTLLREGF